MNVVLCDLALIFKFKRFLVIHLPRLARLSPWSCSCLFFLHTLSKRMPLCLCVCLSVYVCISVCLFYVYMPVFSTSCLISTLPAYIFFQFFQFISRCSKIQEGHKYLARHRSYGLVHFEVKYWVEIAIFAVSVTVCEIIKFNLSKWSRI